ncbi:MAG: type II secretion system F family protein [Candidatus Sumerlaea chitinivorans]|nr:type II secretion system F family protein [Candidatus Sumerlaea chitinivorans]
MLLKAKFSIVLAILFVPLALGSVFIWREVLAAATEVEGVPRSTADQMVRFGLALLLLTVWVMYIYLYAQSRYARYRVAVLRRAYYCYLRDGIELGGDPARLTEGFAKNDLPQAMQKVFTEIAAELRTGAPLSNALSKRPAIFPSSDLAVITTAEKGDSLSAALSMLSEPALWSPSRFGANRHLILAYSEGLVLLAVSWLIFMRYSVLEQEFLQSDVAPAKIWPFSYGLLAVWPYVVVGVLVLALGIRVLHFVYRRSALTCRMVRAIAGPLREFLWQEALIRFSLTLGTFLKYGVPIEQSLRAAVRASRDPVLRAFLPQMEKRLAAGMPLKEVFAIVPQLSREFSNLLARAQSSDSMPNVLLTAGRAQLEIWVKRRHALARTLGISAHSIVLLSGVGLATTVYLAIFKIVTCIPYT